MSGQTVADQATTAISGSRTITLTAHGRRQFLVDLVDLVDLVGYLV